MEEARIKEIKREAMLADDIFSKNKVSHQLVYANELPFIISYEKPYSLNRMNGTIVFDSERTVISTEGVTYKLKSSKSFTDFITKQIAAYENWDEFNEYKVKHC